MKNKEFSLHGVYSYLVPEVWEKIEPMLQESILYSDNKYTTRNIFDALITKNMQLWVVVNKYNSINAFAITEIVNYPNKKVLIILFAGGYDVDLWIDNIELLHNFADFNDCESVEIYGRNGWAKKLLPFNYDKIHSVYRHEIRIKDNAKKDMD